MRRAIVLMLIVLAVGAACSKPTLADAKTQAASVPGGAASAPTGLPAQEPQSAIKPVPAQLPDVVANVNGEPINKAELENAIRGLEGRAGGSVPPDQRDRVYRGMLGDMIAYHLLLQEAKTRKVAVPETDVDARIAQLRGQFQTEDAFKQALAQQKLTLEQVRADSRSQMLVSKLLEVELGAESKVTPEQVNDFYQKNADKFKQGERVRASHILIAVPQNADAAAKQQAKTKAEDVLTELKAGKDFAALAKERSEDPGSAVNGGDLGLFDRGQMVGPFDQVAFSLKPGEMSELVETPFGYHIIKVAEKQASRTVPLEEAKAQIAQYLTGQNRQAQTEAFVNALKAKAKIDIFM